jgi:hypothetical protein
LGKYYHFLHRPLGINYPHEVYEADMMLLPVRCVVYGDEELHIPITTWSVDGVEIKGK